MMTHLMAGCAAVKVNRHALSLMQPEFTCNNPNILKNVKVKANDSKTARQQNIAFHTIQVKSTALLFILLLTVHIWYISPQSQ